MNNPETPYAMQLFNVFRINYGYTVCARLLRLSESFQRPQKKSTNENSHLCLNVISFNFLSERHINIWFEIGDCKIAHFFYFVIATKPGPFVNK